MHQTNRNRRFWQPRKQSILAVVANTATALDTDIVIIFSKIFTANELAVDIAEIGNMQLQNKFVQKIPRTVWVLGFVSLLTDISSEMINSLLPLFLVSVLGANILTVGIIEGIAEATASILKIFSGVLSDYLGHRKGLALLPASLLAGGLWQTLGAEATFIAGSLFAIAAVLLLVINRKKYLQI